MYRFGEDESCPNTFHFHEQYKGKEGYDAHSEETHLIAWEQFSATDPFTEPPKVIFFKEIKPAAVHHAHHEKTHHGAHHSHHRSQHVADETLKTIGSNVTCQLKTWQPLYCVTRCIKVKPRKRESFLLCIQALQRGTLKHEPLAVTYVYGEDENEPNTFIFHEQYQGRQGFEAHTKTPHFAEWEKWAGQDDPFVEPPTEVCFVEAASHNLHP